MSERPFRILMVLDHAFPPDLRVENEARTLVEAGFDVTILAIGPDERPAQDTLDGIRIIRDSVPGPVRNWMRGLAGTLGLPSRLLDWRIRRAYQKRPFDALHLHDLYLFGGGVRAARALGVPVVGDLHENWVEALKHYKWSSTFPRNLVVRIPKWERLERQWVNAVDRLVVVVDEAVERNRALGVAPGRIVEVPNTVRIEEFGELQVDPELVRRVRASFTVVYTGGMDIHRGLDTAIRAMSIVASKRPDARLLLVGDGSVRPGLEALVSELGLEEHVIFHGWQPQNTIRSWIEAADICLVPHKRTVHTDATLPHKLFHYMYAGKPVVVSDCLPLDRIVTQERCGIVVPDTDPEAMGHAILKLAGNPVMAAEMAARGREAVLARWNWTATAQGLVRMYKELAEDRGGVVS